MRGDSLRDLYAKTLALLGLAALAGAGAMVDYWPVASDVPRVAAAPVLRPEPQPVPWADALEIPARMTRLASPPSPVRETVTPTPEVFASLPVGGETPIGKPVALEAPPMFDVMPVVATAVPASEVALSTPPDALPEPRPAAATPALQIAANPPDGLITGALKKTGASIVKTGVVTGASIVDAFRGFVGMFKKVSPFLPMRSPTSQPRMLTHASITP